MPDLWGQLSQALERSAMTPEAPAVTARNVAVAFPGEAAKRSAYVHDLANRAAVRKEGRVSIKARTLLREFGYERRSPLVLRSIASHLAMASLETDLTLGHPRSLDDSVTVSLTSSGPATPTSIGSPAQPVPAGQALRAQASFDLADAAEHAVSATVTIDTPDGIGSGFLVDADGLVVTGCHVVSSEDGGILRTVRARLADDQELQGTVFRFHRRLDFALMWLSRRGPFPALEIGDPRSLRAAETVLAIGSPSAFRNTVSRGIVSNPRQFLNGVECIQTDASIDHGNSGGPLVNRRGEAVGINLWGWGILASGKFALPLDYVIEDIHQAVGWGRDRCLEARCCPLCGFAEIDRPTWYCRNCGARTDGTQNEVP